MPSGLYPDCKEFCNAPESCACVNKEYHDKAWTIAWQLEREAMDAGQVVPPGFVDRIAHNFLRFITSGEVKP